MISITVQEQSSTELRSKFHRRRTEDSRKVHAEPMPSNPPPVPDNQLSSQAPEAVFPLVPALAPALSGWLAAPTGALFRKLSASKLPRIFPAIGIRLRIVCVLGLKSLVPRL